MASSVEDVVNEALSALGWRKPIGDMYEGSPASRAALDVYGETRDELLAQGDWPFALREAALAASSQTPPSPWVHEYTYPADCLRIRAVRPGPLTGGTRSTDPKPILYRTWNDNRPATPIRAILCANPGADGAVLVYTGKITNPATWEPGFSNALVERLAAKIGPRLKAGAELWKAHVGLAAEASAGAMRVDDMRGPPLPGMAQDQR